MVARKYAAFYSGTITVEPVSCEWNGTPSPVTDNQVRLIPNQLGTFDVRVIIDGTPVTGILDTGATLITVCESTAKSLGLNVSGGTLGTATMANGTTTHFRLCKANSVRIGGFEARDVEIGVILGPEALDPLIGQSLLSQIVYSIDCQRRVLTILEGQTWDN
jgi:aspartyl protease family protein